MTERNKRESLYSQILMGFECSMDIEMRKTKLGAVAIVSGVLALDSLSEETVEILSHSGRAIIRGTDLSVSVFSDRTVEVIGKILSLELKYARI